MDISSIGTTLSPASSSKLTAVTTVTAPLKHKNIKIVHLSNTHTCTVTYRLANGSTFAPHVTDFYQFCRTSNAAVSRNLMLCFGNPRSFANRSIVRLRKRNNVVLRGRLLTHIFRLNTGRTDTNRFSCHTFSGSGLSLMRTRTVTSTVSTADTTTTDDTVHSLDNRFSRGVGRLLRRLVRLHLRIRTTVSFPSRRSISFLSSNIVRTGLRRARRGVRRILTATGRNRLLHSNVRIMLTNEPGTNGSDLLGHLTKRRHTVIASITNAAHSALRRAIMLGNLALRLASATNLHSARSAIRHVNVRHTHATVARTSVLVVICSIAHSLRRRDAPLRLTRRLFNGLPRTGQLLVVTGGDSLLGNLDSRSTVSTSRVRVGGHNCRRIGISYRANTNVSALIRTLYTGINFRPPRGDLVTHAERLSTLEHATGCLARTRRRLAIFRTNRLITRDLHRTRRDLNRVANRFDTSSLLNGVFNDFYVNG